MSIVTRINQGLQHGSVSQAHIDQFHRDVGVTIRDAKVKVVVTDFDGCVAGFGADYMRKEDVRKLILLIKAARENGTEVAVASAAGVLRLRSFLDATGTSLFDGNGNLAYPNGSTPLNVAKEVVDFGLGVAATRLGMFMAKRLPWSTESLIDEAARVVDFAASTRLADVSYKGSKANAIHGIKNHFGVTGDQLLLIGNGHVDIPAFREVRNAGGIVVAPRNSSPSVQAYLESNRDDPRVIAHPLSSTECAISVFTMLNRA